MGSIFSLLSIIYVPEFVNLSHSCSLWQCPHTGVQFSYLADKVGITGSEVQDGISVLCPNDSGLWVSFGGKNNPSVRFLKLGIEVCEEEQGIQLILNEWN